MPLYRNVMEARPGFEPGNRGFADPRLSHLAIGPQMYDGVITNYRTKIKSFFAGTEVCTKILLNPEKTFRICPEITSVISTRPLAYLGRTKTAKILDVFQYDCGFYCFRSPDLDSNCKQLLRKLFRDRSLTLAQYPAKKEVSE